MMEEFKKEHIQIKKKIEKMEEEWYHVNHQKWRKQSQKVENVE